MKEFNLLVWLTQLGISVAVPLALCTIGSVWLRNRFQLGPWVLFVGIGLGLFCAIDGFCRSLKLLEQQNKDKKEKTPPVSYGEHD